MNNLVDDCSITFYAKIKDNRTSENFPANTNKYARMTNMSRTLSPIELRLFTCDFICVLTV